MILNDLLYRLNSRLEREQMVCGIQHFHIFQLENWEFLVYERNICKSMNHLVKWILLQDRTPMWVILYNILNKILLK